MKKKILLLILLLLPLTACNKIDKTIETKQQEINTKVEDYRNISKTSIIDSYNYIEDNYTNKKDKDNLIYNALYLKELSKYDTNNAVYILSDDLIEYLKNNKQKKDIQEDIDIINKNKNTELENVYKGYMVNGPIKKALNKQTKLALSDSNDKSFTNKNTIKKSVDYLDTHIVNVLENDEVIEQMAYHTLFLTNLSKKDSMIANISKKTNEYLNTLDDKTKTEIIELLNKYKKNEDKELTNFYKNIK